MMALFPGQGSQHVGMGKDLCENFSIARQTFEEASDILKLDLKKLCFEGPESDLALTENTQPCLLAHSIASYRTAQEEFGFRPTLVAGHSLGEYSALVAAESLSFSEALRWVRQRGRVMQQAVPVGMGSMTAVLGMEDEALEALCKRAIDAAQEKAQAESLSSSITLPPVVEPANYNAPGQTVVAGSLMALEQMVALQPQGVKMISLPVSAPFHCSLMSSAREAMRKFFSNLLENQKPKQLACPYIPNRTARLSQESGVVLDLLVEQIDHPVFWKQSMKTALENSVRHAVEFGPGKVLAGLMKRIATPLAIHCSVLSVGDSSSLKNLGDFYAK